MRALGRVFALVIAVTVAGAAPAAAQSTEHATSWLIPPVDGPISRHFEPPQGPYGPGHRGIDLAVPEGTPVRAAAAGTVSFAGVVAGVLAVTIDHPSGLQTTYSDLGEVQVRRGQEVGESTIIGYSARSHRGGEAGLHLGVKAGDRYLDPEAYLGPLDLSAALHLAPVRVEATDDVGRPCRELEDLQAGRLTAPNDNIAVAVAGLGSSSQDGTMFTWGPQTLGYPGNRVYRFSYAGVQGPRLHRRYTNLDTFRNLKTAARRMRDLLRQIAKRHPGAQVDLLAHSQGGVVARYFLERYAGSWDDELPHVDHFVTFDSPHGGAPAAAMAEDLDRYTLSGRVLNTLSGLWARAGGPLPDARSTAVHQLAAGSSFMDELARHEVVYGTRTLSLADPVDAIVPADRALMPSGQRRVTAPNGLWTHAKAVGSPESRALAYAFLRDAPLDCPDLWDRIGPWIGRGIGVLERVAPFGIAAAEGRLALVP
ncbi:MAG TPA: peptidoglycan DD-metalloendopeptidase family protein [Actinomycetota bacterium]|nr:peptidoglycan DD-metalloendopeptidase family protein [Actinomycetota bacterium]